MTRRTGEAGLGKARKLRKETVGCGERARNVDKEKVETEESRPSFAIAHAIIGRDYRVRRSGRILLALLHPSLLR